MICGVKLKMTTTYHPEMDGSSECMNKTINQSLHFHMDHPQKGWVCTLPKIWFAIMSTVNASMGFSNFQPHISCSPHIIPPIIPSTLPANLHSTCSQVEEMICHINTGFNKVQDNLTMAKAFQAHYTNTSCGVEIVYKVSNHMMLLTFH